VLGKLPIDPRIAEAVDKGAIEELEGDWLDSVANYLKENHPPVEAKRKKEDIKKVKIAVPCDEENNVDQHFNKAKKICVCEIENNKLINRTHIEVENDKKLEDILVENKITTVICGGIAADAMQTLFQAGIKVVPGASGDVDVAISSLA
jgi:predicted Fe-Mo cluster-binding NifX family protein